MKKIIKKIIQKIKQKKPIYIKDGVHLNFKEYSSLKKLNLDIVDVLETPIETLNFELSLDYHKVTSVFFIDKNEELNFQITNSPHYKLIMAYIEANYSTNDEIILNSEYFSFYKKINERGYKINWFNPTQKHQVYYSDDDILAKSKKFLKLYNNIKSEGYLGKNNLAFPILVLKKPLACTRFQLPITDNYCGFEILSGHHRASILAALGYEKIKVVVLEDKSPGKYHYENL